MAIQRELHGYRISDGVDLSLRVGIGASQVAAVHVGGLGGRWELVLTGSALAQGLRYCRGMNFGLSQLWKEGRFDHYDAFFLLTNDNTPLGVLRHHRAD